MNKTMRFKELIKELQTINFAPIQTDKTFLEIIKKPCDEVCISNLLEFFIDPENPHDLEDVFIQSLINLSGITEDVGDFEEVCTEYYTKKGKKIDIVIKMSNFTIGIENKINAGLYNDLEEYHKALKTINKEKEPEKIYENNVQLIVLSLQDLRKEQETLKEGNAINITYEEFFREIKSQLASSITDMSTDYYVILKQFIKGIEKMQNPEKNLLTPEEYELIFDNMDIINNAKKSSYRVEEIYIKKI